MTGGQNGEVQAPRNPADHLKQWRFKQGNRASPGRPKGSGTLAGDLAKILGQEVEDLKTGRRSTRREIAAERLVEAMESGNLQAWAVVLRYCPEVMAEHAPLTGAVCDSCGAECSSCKPAPLRDPEQRRAELGELVKVLAEAGVVDVACLKNSATATGAP